MGITLTGAELAMLGYLRAAKPNAHGWIEFNADQLSAERRMDIDILVLAGFVERRHGSGSLEPQWFNQWRLLDEPASVLDICLT